MPCEAGAGPGGSSQACDSAGGTGMSPLLCAKRVASAEELLAPLLEPQPAAAAAPVPSLPPAVAEAVAAQLGRVPLEARLDPLALSSRCGEIVEVSAMQAGAPCKLQGGRRAGSLHKQKQPGWDASCCQCCSSNAPHFPCCRCWCARASRCPRCRCRRRLPRHLCQRSRQRRNRLRPRQDRRRSRREQHLCCRGGVPQRPPLQLALRLRRGSRAGSGPRAGRAARGAWN